MTLKDGMTFRAPREEDWPGILDIANASVADVEGAGTQEEWLQNRQTFARNGIQHHFVCLESGQLIGYGSAEHAPDAPDDSYRLLVVTLPDRLYATGEAIIDELELFLAGAGAKGSWFVEYVDDLSLTGFIQDHGYNESKCFNLDSGIEVAIYARGQVNFHAD
jgi:hypothetical protein